MEQQTTNRKKTGLLVALALCCILAVGGGVMAWFSAQDQFVNVFTSGDGITDPEHKPQPGEPETPDPSNPTDPETDGKIFEDKWVPESAISPDSVVAKNPNIGIGKTSRPAYVFAEVENNLGDGTYFLLNDNWMPVAAAQYKGAQGWASIHVNDTAAQAKAYTSGLFVYVGKGGATTGDPVANMAMLTPKTVNDSCGGAYTGELFSKVYAGKTAVINADNPDMVVKAYLAASSNDSENMEAAKQEILDSAKKWVVNNNQ